MACHPRNRGGAWLHLLYMARTCSMSNIKSEFNQRDWGRAMMKAEFNQRDRGHAMPEMRIYLKTDRYLSVNEVHENATSLNQVRSITSGAIHNHIRSSLTSVSEDQMDFGVEDCRREA